MARSATFAVLRGPCLVASCGNRTTHEGELCDGDVRARRVNTSSAAAQEIASVAVVWEDESATPPDRQGPDAVRMKIVPPP